MVKIFFQCAVITFLLLLVAFMLLRVADTDPEQMRQKYGNDVSQQIADGQGGFIHYRDQGRKDGPVLLLVHGSDASLHTWEPLVALLAQEYRLISYDQHGHGLTGPHAHKDYRAAAKIGAAVKILDALSVDKATWVGSSMGGWIVWRAAMAVPERVSALVLVDASGAQVDEKYKPYLGARLRQSWIGQQLLPHITPRFIVKSSLVENFVNSDLVTEPMVDRYWELIRFPGNRDAAIERIKTNREPDKWQEISDITMPTLILWGEQDKVIPVSHAAAFHSAISTSELIVYPQVGHLPMEEVPQQVATDIRRWLSDD